MKTFEYRLYPTKEQNRLLTGCLSESRTIYNKMLEQSIREYERHGKFLFKYDLIELWSGKEYEYAPASTVQCLADRLDKAFQAFIRRKDNGQEGGFPRFKPANRWRSIHLRQYMNKCGDFHLKDCKRLSIPKKLGHKIKIKLHRPLEGTPKTCHLVLRADGHWYALIVCDLGDQVKTLPTAVLLKKTIGIDVGLKSFLTTSDNETVKNPRYYQKSQKRLRIKQRRICRRRKWKKKVKQGKKGALQYQKQSNGYYKATRETAKQHLKIKRQRKDFHHKQANRLVGKYRLIAVEGLDLANWLPTNFHAKSINDAGWYGFIQILSNKAESAGHRVVKVDPRYTSQECNSCGTLVKKSLSVRTHKCLHCGYIADRDLNAAKNILERGIDLVLAEKRAGAQPVSVKPSARKVSLRSRQPKG